MIVLATARGQYPLDTQTPKHTHLQCLLMNQYWHVAWQIHWSLNWDHASNDNEQIITWVGYCSGILNIISVFVSYGMCLFMDFLNSTALLLLVWIHLDFIYSVQSLRNQGSCFQGRLSQDVSKLDAERKKNKRNKGKSDFSNQRNSNSFLCRDLFCPFRK